ncbi:hypothetical protein FHL15_006373 [Xylaria flabelliformis]|uniref:Uncharacterized protein n=1 Tax=Xylaria flabelliformis TaxID=2512241 RepID=A0A553HXM2_9PEZI|nr:hypothetical protein FHL15_006373 [Xylaria flabelliformis]
MTNHAKYKEAEEWVDYFTNLARKIRLIWANLTTPSFAQFSEVPLTAQPYIEIKHDSCQVSMAVNTDALAADWSMREEKHAERIPYQNRGGPEARTEARQDGPGFTFGGAARQEERLPQNIQMMQCLTSSTTITVSHNTTRPMGVNLGMNGLGTALGLGGGMLGRGHRRAFLSIDGNILVIIACVLLAIWFFKG